MDVYKTKVGQTTRTKISVKNFERDTLREAPYCQAGKPGKEPSYFVVCPACENPIQILGLYKKLAHTPDPLRQALLKVSALPGRTGRLPDLPPSAARKPGSQRSLNDTIRKCDEV